MITAERYHDFSCGHRVVGHEGKCRYLHGHNYRVTFVCAPPEGTALDEVGRVVDFSVIKEQLCRWLEVNWDHRMLIWKEDPILGALQDVDPDGVRVVPFNPTAENMAVYLLTVIGPLLLNPIRLVEVKVEETRKCSAVYKLEGVCP